MSRGGFRYGAGRPGWKGKVEQCLALDVRRLARHNVLREEFSGSWHWSRDGERIGSIGLRAQPYYVILDYKMDGQPNQQAVRILRTPCPFGGSRPWFRCPACAGRVAVIYGRDGRFACRRCQRLAYSSQSEDTIDRTWRLERKLEAKLAPRLRRPKGMHTATYNRIKRDLRASEMRRYQDVDALWERLAPFL